MDVYRRIQEQQETLKSPLFAISLVAANCADTPVILFLHWHGFHHETPTDFPGVRRPLRSLPASAVQINERWTHAAHVEGGTLDAAWQCGAWDLQRSIHRPCRSALASEIEAENCRRAFGEYGTGQDSSPAQLLDDAAPDRHELMALAGKTGYIKWVFRPVSGGVWGDALDDTTLGPDGKRDLPCPVSADACSPPLRSVRRAQGARKTYRLGRRGGPIEVIG